MPSAPGSTDLYKTNGTSPPLTRLLSILSQQGRSLMRSGKGYVAMCPAHDDRKQSLSIGQGDDGRVLLKCHAGCEVEVIVKELGLTMSDLFDGSTRASAPKATDNGFNIVATYDYQDEQGELLSQVVRLDPKGFRRRKPDGNGGWIYQLGDVRRVLYRLHELKGKKAVVFVEGEKDADALWQLKIPATTSIMGAAHWRPEYAEQLKRAECQRLVIIPDNDAPGRKHAQVVAAAMHAVGIEVFVVALEGLPEKGDVSDFLAAAQHPRGDLLREIERLKGEPWTPSAASDPEPAPAAASSKTTITTNTFEDWHDLLDEVFTSLVAVNAPQPALFQRGLRLVRVRVDEDERPLIEPMTESSLKGQLAASLLWQRRELRGGMVPVQPPDAVIKNLLARSEWGGIPALRDIIQSPVFTKDGAIITSTGYHAGSRLWYAPASGLAVTVPAAPSERIIQRARAYILEELLGEFPFTEEASRAHAVAAIILPFVRELIEGPTPLHAYTAPTAGSGKGLLVELTSIIATGHPALPVSAPREDEEMRKRITSQLRRGTPIIVLDNLSAKLESAALCAALTSEEWSDRVLGVSEMTPALPNRALWICTANNPEFSLDVARRTVVVRIDSGQECPWKRTFRHPNIKAWAREHRGALVSAVLTLIQGWLAAGRPTVEHPPIGSFEGWAAVMSGVLGHSGIHGFLTNYEAIFAQSSGETGEWADFVEEWFELKGNAPVLAKDLFALTNGSDLLINILGDGTEHGQRVRFGTALAKQKDRVYGGLQIRLDGRGQGGSRYHLRSAPRSGV